jgi:uncharacterized protein (DUF1810 family)
LADIKEANAYLAHTVFGQRLREITSVLLTHTDEDAATLMGSIIDATKLRSSMTLFNAAVPNDIFKKVLDAFFEGKGDAETLRRISK